MSPRYETLRGVKDILPDEVERWRWVEGVARDVARRFGFRELRTPVIERAELFARSVGASSDIVRKEMYTLDVGDETICLRPEGTASMARAFVEHALYRSVGQGFPERYFALGPMFRHERPQKGRQREFHQLGVEVFGAGQAQVDAETIELAWTLLAELGLGGLELALNSVGDGACRPAYRQRLQQWLAAHRDRLCADCQRRAEENPLRVFDCKVEADRALLAAAPTIDQALCAPCREHFDEVRARLDAAGVPFRIEPRIVRGLDYYQRTVFEVASRELGAQGAVLGGGRYDGLVEELGGPPTPAFGFAAGLERLVLLVPAARVPAASIDVALIALGAEGWEAALPLARRLRARGLACLVPCAPRPLGAQLRRAAQAAACFALFIGRDEVAAGRFGFKDLRSGAQETLDEAALTARLLRERA